MKIAVLNNSGNVGKTTIAKHLLSPRLQDCPIIHIETINEGGDASNFKGKQLMEVLTAANLHTNAIVDIGSSNIEAVYAQLKKLHDAHEEFDYYVVPAVPSPKQQRDTANTVETLLAMGVPAEKIKLVFNMIEIGDSVDKVFPDLVKSAKELGIPTTAVIHQNELFEIIGDETVAQNIVDIPKVKEKLAKTANAEDKRVLATAIGVSRLAKGVQEEMDAAFSVLFPA